jgi:mannan endo-1,4-beta-mannosidase
VDHEAYLAMPSIDFGTFHLYPDNWGVSTKWGNQWIVDHIEAAQKAGKPTVLEEYGVVVKRDHATNAVTRGFERREQAYRNWNNLMLHRGGTASLFWMLVGLDPYNQDTSLYKDYDGFSVYNVEGEQTASILEEFAGQYAESAQACKLAHAAGVSGEPSPFVSAARVGGVAMRARTGQALAVNWLR